MKKPVIILICVFTALISCTKSKEVHPEIGDGNDEIITVGVKDVHVEYTRADMVELQKVVFHYRLSGVQQFTAAEMTKREVFFELILTDLLSDTLYSYYYELFPNNGDILTTVQKTFHTQVMDSPAPPEPPTPQSGAPEGAINGLFTVNENGDQVYFSQGNLQYQASTNTWRFAENQWDYVGGTYFSSIEFGNVYYNGIKCSNSLMSSDYSGWIDLFGWGTSGIDHGAICYQPWSTSMNNSDYYAYGNYNYNLSDQNGQADWGHNAISNGGNAIDTWRTLSCDEWDYLLNERNTVSGIRYARAKVNDVDGLLILPDDWNSSIFDLFETNVYNASTSVNTISLSDWVNALEKNGCIFLPAAAVREGTNVFLAQTFMGAYWTDTSHDSDKSYNLFFDDSALGPMYYTDRFKGQSVRLVLDYNKNT